MSIKAISTVFFLASLTFAVVVVILVIVIVGPVEPQEAEREPCMGFIAMYNETFQPGLDDVFAITEQDAYQLNKSEWLHDKVRQMISSIRTRELTEVRQNAESIAEYCAKLPGLSITDS